MPTGAATINLIVNNLLTHYLAEGPATAPVVLMLHGWGASLQTFDGLAHHLASQFRVVRLDLPGFGGTERPQGDWHIQDYAQFVVAFLAKLDIPHPPYIVAHSFGGRITLKAVGQGMIAPRQLILMGSAGVKHSRSARNQLYKLVAKTGKVVTSLPGLSAVRTRLRKALYDSAGSDYLTSGDLRQIFLNTIHEDLQTDAAAITAPTLLIWGANDTATPLADASILQGQIRTSRLQVIPQAGHFVYLDAPQAVTALIDGALKN